MKKITMRAIDALHIEAISKDRYNAIIREHGSKGRVYPVVVEVGDQ